MPLKPGSSRTVVSENVREMVRAGHPQKQAVAASLKKAGLSNKYDDSPSRIPGVEIFAAGSFRGKKYTPADLDRMAENFERVSKGQKPGFRVPVVLGHEEDQRFLEREDLPAAGWVSKVWVDPGIPGVGGEKLRTLKGLSEAAGNGDEAAGNALHDFLEENGLPEPQWKLKADFEDVPPKVARLIRGRQYRTVSSEVYDEPPEGVPGRGKMLRRVALLGGNIPQVKTLDDIPTPERYSERLAAGRPTRIQFSHANELPSGAWACFSEVKPMDRDEVLKKLAEHGADVETLKDAPDEHLNETLRLLDAKDAEHADHDDSEGRPAGDLADAGHPDQTSVYDDEEFPEPEGDEERGHMAMACRRMAEKAMKGFHKYMGRKYDEVPENDQEMGAYAEKFGALPEEQLRAIFAKVDSSGKGKRVDSSKGDKSGHYKRDAMKGNWPSKKHSDKGGRAVSTFSEADVRRIVDQAVGQALEKHVGSKIERFEKFTEQQLGAQRMTAVDAILDELEKEGKLPPAERAAERETLLELDPVTVHKFSEGGKTVRATKFDRRVAMLRRRPSKFSERFATPGKKDGRGGSGKDDRKEWAASTFEKFSDSFKATGQTVESFTAAALAADEEQFEDLRKSWDNR